MSTENVFAIKLYHVSGIKILT